ncbi:hypothetical protein [Cytobacillus praedii]|uniref:hypothetical protein n=1 Tax=Cytobacillus praedii TaxID=1742358 RepID=UPI002E1AD730|nr:hypothetical protein [Cytobacillus praedii]
MGNILLPLEVPIDREFGKTIIRNATPIFNESELNALLGLLHNDYSNLGMIINIYTNEKQVIEDWVKILTPYLSIQKMLEPLKKQVHVCHTYSVISIFPFNCKIVIDSYFREKLQLYTLFDLIHEIRHQYQQLRMPKKYKKKSNKSLYHSLWTERDANHFAQRFINNNKEEINRILDINVVGTVYGDIFLKQNNFYKKKRDIPSLNKLAESNVVNCFLVNLHH